MRINRQYYILIPFIIFLIAVNIILFYNILGYSVFIFTGSLFLIIFVIVGFIYYQRKGIYPHPKFFIKQENSLAKETAMDLQSKAFTTVERTNFVIHKWILIAQLAIIVILLLNLIIKIWQKE